MAILVPPSQENRWEETCAILSCHELVCSIFSTSHRFMQCCTNDAQREEGSLRNSERVDGGWVQATSDTVRVRGQRFTVTLWNLELKKMRIWSAEQHVFDHVFTMMHLLLWTYWTHWSLRARWWNNLSLTGRKVFRDQLLSPVCPSTGVFHQCWIVGVFLCSHAQGSFEKDVSNPGSQEAIVSLQRTC